MERLRCCVAALWHGAVVLGLACIAPRGLSDCRVAVWGLRLRNAPHHSFVGSRSKMAGEAAPPAATCDTAPMACMTHRAPAGGVRAAVQALQRGRAEGRLELIKGDEKKVRVGGAGEGAGERREAKGMRGGQASYGGRGRAGRPRKHLGSRASAVGGGSLKRARGQAPHARGALSLSDASASATRGCTRCNASGVGQPRAVSERCAVQVALDGEPGAVTFRCLLPLNRHATHWRLPGCPIDSRFP
jgi:hypothetical protein